MDDEFVNWVTNKICQVYGLNGSELGLIPVYKRPVWLWKALNRLGIPERRCVIHYGDPPTFSFEYKRDNAKEME